MTNDELIRKAYRRYGRWSIGNDVNQIDREGYEYWLEQLDTKALAVEEFNSVFDAAVRQSWNDNPNSIHTFYTKAFSPGGGEYAEYIQLLKENGKLEFK